jgi:hypothetical protein
MRANRTLATHGFHRGPIQSDDDKTVPAVRISRQVMLSPDSPIA